MSAPVNPGLDLLYTATEAARMTHNYIEDKIQNKELGVNFGIPNVDEVLTPAFPGDFWGICGRPGGGKSSVMVAWSRFRSFQIGRTEVLSKRKRKVFFATGEQVVEELSAFNAAAMTGVNTEMMKRGSLTEKELRDTKVAIDNAFDWPLWYIGRSIERYRTRQPLTVHSIGQTVINAMDKFGIEPDVVFVDYLTALDILPGKNYTESLIEAMVEIKRLCFDTRCPWILGVQASQEVDSRTVDRKPAPVPGLGDAEWIRGAGGQKFDTMLSVTRPILYVEKGDPFGKTNSCVQEDDILIKIIKQKVGKGNVPIWAKLDPRYNRLEEAQVERAFKRDIPSPTWSRTQADAIYDGEEN